jgi:hypothetical protein
LKLEEYMNNLLTVDGIWEGYAFRSFLGVDLKRLTEADSYNFFVIKEEDEENLISRQMEDLPNFERELQDSGAVSKRYTIMSKDDDLTDRISRMKLNISMTRQEFKTP